VIATHRPDRRDAAAAILVLAAAVAAGECAAAAAPEKRAEADYPSRPVRILVGFPPGSSTDMLARLIGNGLGERFPQPVIVDNRPGANGIIAAEATAKASPDGHTLLLMSTSHTMNAAVYKLPFDPVQGYTPIMMLGSGPLVLVAHPSFPASNVKAVIALAKAQPGAINYAIAGTGGINHFSGALFARMAGVELTHVPYKGGAQAMTDVIGGQVELMFGTAALALRHMRSGRVKAIGVTTAQRTRLLPGVPTIAESGLPGYHITTWWGLLGPAGMPAAVLTRLNAEIGAILAQPETVKRLEADGAETQPLPGAEFATVLVSEVDKWKRIARESAIRSD
jgi:tripartite-type tricarboxylate transporter receptor subunit TctC